MIGAIPGGEGGSEAARSGSRRGERLGFLIPILLVSVGAARYLQAPADPYDGGLLLTLARFTDPSTMPYRDLWTLYGPGPPIFGSLIMIALGPGLLPLRIAYLILHGLLVVAVYAVARRFVPWWAAVLLTLPVATFAYSHRHFHFAGSVALIVWGFWFLLRAQDQPRLTVRRAAVGAFLIGTAFWGRYEFVVLSLILVVALWLFLRPRITPGHLVVLAAGLIPPVVFLGYLIGPVGWEHTYLNLIDYPLRLYPEPFCRGLPDVWGQAFNGLLAPLRGRLWSGYEFTLGVGTFAPPILGALVLLKGARSWRERGFTTFVQLATGLVTLIVWLELRPRAGAEPQPIWPLMMVCTTMLLGGLARTRRRLLVAVVAVLGIMISGPLATSWGPEVLPPWVRWPSYDARYGFARMEHDVLYNEQTWGEVVAAVHRYASPGEPIFVALHQNTGHHANLPIFYWVADRPPSSRFIEFDPCLTDTAPVQRLIVEDIDSTDVLITSSYFGQEPPPLGPPSSVLDDYISAHFRTVYEGRLLGQGDISVRLRVPM
jgi:hypothetical protein